MAFSRERALLAALGVLLVAAPPAGARRGAPPPEAASPPALHLVLPPIDRESLLEEDRKTPGPGPLRFALRHELVATPATDGEWERRADGARVWRLQVLAPAATDLNFGFGRFRLPEGAALWASAEDGRHWEGPYTHADNEVHGELWTPVVPGDRATITLLVPPNAAFEPELKLVRIGRGYRDLFGRLGDPLMPKSGACNNDVVCPEGDPWRDQIDSVAVYSFGGDLSCTGQMIADVPRSFRNWFLTASHCGVSAANAPSLVVYWNYQTSTCAGPRDGRLDQSQTGAVFRMSHPDSDTCLVELDAAPDPAFNVYHSGWDATDVPANATVGIHHPSTDEKAISFDADPVTPGDGCIFGTGTDSHWYVGEWEDGTTERGSSGSGLWDADTQLLIGVLSGGAASCGNPDGYDCYGRFGAGWDRGATPDSRLKDWLDPGDTGELTAPGGRASAATLLTGFESSDACPSGGAGDGNGLWEPGENVELTLTLEGTGDLTGVTGILESLTPGVTVLQGAAGWPDLAPGAPRPNDAPAFALSLDDVVCLDEVDLRLTVSANEGGPFVHDFSEIVGPSLAPEAPKPIADNGLTTSELAVAQSLVATSLAVRVELLHSYVGDLRLTLRAPDGREVLLLDRPSDPGGGNCGDDDMEVLFTDDSGFDAESHCAGSTPWLVGDAFPVEPLATLAGSQVLGTWTLVVEDAAEADEGTIEWWELVTEPPLADTCTPCGAAPCPGVEISVADLRVSKAAGGELALTFSGPDSPCAEGVQVRLAADPRPAVGGGSFPGDPVFADVSGEDLDPGPDFRHAPPPGAAYYLVVESLPGGLPGPSGHYGF